MWRFETLADHIDMLFRTSNDNLKKRERYLRKMRIKFNERY